MLISPGGTGGGDVGLGDRVRAQPAAAAVLAAGPVALIGLLGAHLGEQLLVHAPLGLPDALGPVARDRRGLLGALVIQPAPSDLEPLLAAALRSPAPAAAHRRGDPRSARPLRRRSGGRPRSPRAPGARSRRLASRLALAEILLPSIATMFNADQAGPRAQPEHRAEHARQRVLVALDEARDRRVIGLALRRDHPVGDVLDARPLDRPRGPRPARVRVQESARPSSPDQTPAGCARQRDRRHRTRRDPSTRPRRARTTRSDPPATTHARPAASKTTARDHTR